MCKQYVMEMENRRRAKLEKEEQLRRQYEMENRRRAQMEQEEQLRRQRAYGYGFPFGQRSSPTRQTTRPRQQQQRRVMPGYGYPWGF